MISKMMRVAATSANPNTPMEAATDNSTIMIPPKPNVTLLSTWKKKYFTLMQFE